MSIKYVVLLDKGHPYLASCVKCVYHTGLGNPTEASSHTQEVLYGPTIYNQLCNLPVFVVPSE